jgi:hypothetical protein
MIIGRAKTILQLLSSSKSEMFASDPGKIIAAIKFEKNIPKHIPELRVIAYI